MSASEELAARLRQAIQGCAVHNHGPVQAWAAIDEACREGAVQVQDVATRAISACTQRIQELQCAGIPPSDQRIKKEELTRAFITRLLHERE
jgi:hypothetical protein